MSKIALRVYNREIEALTQEGHIDEAVAHCKHILKTFPKHLETYRLLGKAYLEAHDYDSATDIFQRVLTSVPDDFVSHLGISIIADESKNLEQAIWHMERAFESIPSNGGVQAELRRLYGRRDGLEPPKIQLTRPALARMYIRGGKYAQAIQELKSVLQEEPDRLDIKIMMAQAHFRAGQKVEASEICNQVLKISPYCFDANRILSEVLPGTSLESTLTTYRSRLQQLDPYLGLVTGSTFDLSTVKDTGITIERLDWDEALAQQAESGWNTTSAAPAPLETESPSESQEEAIPDWMKSQGWGPSTGEFQEGPLDFDEPESPAPVVSSGEPLAAAELPDWLKGMAPVGMGSNDTIQTEEKPEEADLAWLSGISAASGITLAESEQASPDSAVPDWLAGLGQEEEPVDESGLGTPQEQRLLDQRETSTPDSAVPDWLAGLGQEQPADESGLDTPQEQRLLDQRETSTPESDDTPDWLAGLGQEEPADESGLGTPQEQRLLDQRDTPQEQQLPDQAEISAPGTSEAEQDEAFKWLEMLAAGQGAKPEELLTRPEERLDQAPEWAQNVDSPAQTEIVPGLDTPQEQRLLDQRDPSTPGSDTPDWLAGLGQEEPADESGLGTPQEQRLLDQRETSTPESDDTPDWLAGLGQEEEPADESGLDTPQEQRLLDQRDTPQEQRLFDQRDTPQEQQLPDQAEISAPGTSEAEQDEAFKWLEMLAAGQGAKPEELLTRPEERLDQAPEWAQNVDSPAQTEIVPGLDTPQEQRLLDQHDTPQEQRLLDQRDPSTLESDDDTPDWLAGLGQEQPAGLGTPQEQRLPDQPDISTLESGDDTPDWLAGLGQEEPAGLDTPQEQRLLDQRETSTPESDDIPDWLAGLGQEEPVGLGTPQEQRLPDQRDPSTPKSDDTPDWLAGLGQEEPADESGLGTPQEQRLLDQRDTPQEQRLPDQRDTPQEQQLPDQAEISAPGTSEAEQDEAFKWLEMLAAGQGAKPEELLTRPEERLDQAPEWAQNVDSPAQTEIVPGLDTPQEQWLLDQRETSTPESDDDTPDWLAGLGQEQPADELGLGTPQEQRLPDQPDISTLESGDDTPDWLAGLGQEQPADESGLDTPQEQRLPDQPDISTPESDDDTPDWLAGLDQEEPADESGLDTPQEQRLLDQRDTPQEQRLPDQREVSAPGTSEAEQDEAFKWLEMLAAGQGAKPEELLTRPEERLDQAPEWAQNVAEETKPASPEPPTAFIPEQPIEVEDDGPLGDLSEPVSAPGTSVIDQDEAFRWLENLASAQGARPEELLTQPDERLGQTPGWVENVERPKTELSAPVSGPGTTAAEQDESFKWLENLAAGQGAKPEELLTQPEERLEQTPEWVDNADEVSGKEVAPEIPGGSIPETSSGEQTDFGVTQWLQSLEQEDLPVSPQMSQAAANIDEMEDLPDWLKDEAADEVPPTPMPVSGWVAEESHAADSHWAGAPAPETATPASAPSVPAADLEAGTVQETESAQDVAPVSGQSAALPAKTVPAPPARAIARQTGMLGGDKDAMLLHRARLLLEKSNLDTAMSEYTRLIKKGKYMEEIIFDLQEATYKHPVDVVVWQTLGDAFMRYNRLQDALDAYTKAEELLR